MNILFEEGGAFKTATVLEELPGSYMAETVSGKRSKIKKNQVFLTFSTPSAAQLLGLAQPIADELDIDFLWECAPEDDFDFRQFAEDYFGSDADTAASAAMLLKLHAVPMYFNRRGKGVFRRALAENLKAALAGQEKKLKTQAAVDALKHALIAGELPDAVADKANVLLYRPDKHSIEYKALDAACQEKKTNPIELLHELGAIPSHYRYHLDRFLFDYFPEGIDFPPLPISPVSLEGLPLATVSAFSIDDETTIEFDDAFSVEQLDKATWRIGIHIAAPALFFEPESEIDLAARKRLSTVYMPGDRITMLPESVVEASTLAAGRCCPTLSYYRTVERRPDGGFDTLAESTRLDRVTVSDNLVSSTVEAELDALIAAGKLDAELADKPAALLYRLAVAWQAERLEKIGTPQGNDRVDFSFYVDDDDRVTIVERRRGGPLDTLVSEMMILVNSRWAQWLRDADLPAVYRTQGSGKVRMTTAPSPHAVLGLGAYGWSSSPLRRYVDLVNQRQLLAGLRETPPCFGPNDERLLAIIGNFELTYAAYNEFQYQIERYWCLRWLEQEKISVISAVVLKDQLIRLDGLPLTVKSKSLPSGITGKRVEVRIESINFWEISLHARYLRTLD